MGIQVVGPWDGLHWFAFVNTAFRLGAYGLAVYFGLRIGRKLHRSRPAALLVLGKAIYLTATLLGVPVIFALSDAVWSELADPWVLAPGLLTTLGSWCIAFFLVDVEHGLSEQPTD